MSNIILIDEDDRARRQMELFLAELGEDNRVRSFKTYKEFENLYFRTAVDAKPTTPFLEHPQLKKFSPAQQIWLLEQKLSQGSPFPFPALRLTLEKTHGKVEWIDPVPTDDIDLFNIPIADFKEQRNAVENLLPVDFQKTYSDLVANSSLEKPLETILPFYSATGELWMCLVRVVKAGKTVNVTIENNTSRIAEDIRQILEKLKTQSEEDETLKLLSEIDLVIVKALFVSNKPTTWADQFFANLKKFKLYPPDFRTRLVITKYEDDGISKMDLIHPLIDDIIFLPLDRLIFLQKVEIILGLPEKITPSFLFSQEAKLDIEIAKRSWMERLSDVALAIRNPVPLIPGLFGVFFIDLPGEKESFEVYGKVIRSEPHPNYPGEFLVYFSYFSMNKDIQSRIRKFLSKDSHYSSLLQDDEQEFAFNPDNLFLTEDDRRLKNIILIDSEADSYEQVLNIVKEDIDQVQVAAFSSYSAFLAKYFADQDTNINIADLQALSLAELFGGQCCWTVNIAEKELVEFSPPTLDNSTALGYTSEDLFADKISWKKLFSQKDQESLLEEIFRITETGRAFSSIIFFTDTSGKQKALHLAAHQQPRGIQFTLSIPKPEAIKEFALLQSKFTSWDVLIIDTAVLPPNAVDWVMNIENNAKAKGYLKANENLKVILVDHSNSKRDLKEYKASQFRALVVRPIEPRSLLFNLSSILNLPYTVYNFSNMGWSHARVAVQVAKEAQLHSLAEFGASIRHARPIAPGTFLFLRGSIFDNAPRRNLCARFYAFEEDSAESGTYICHLIYFGINEAFSKFARSWFRETYAASKQTEE